MSVVAKRLHGLRCRALGTEVGLGPGDFVFEATNNVDSYKLCMKDGCKKQTQNQFFFIKFT